MPVYATADDPVAYIDGLTITDPAGFDALIERAERQVDALLGPIRRDRVTGLKLDPARLDTYQREALARAVSAQVEWLLERGPALGLEAPAVSVKGPDFEAQYGPAGASPPIGPKVAAELEPLRELLRPRGVRARP